MSTAEDVAAKPSTGFGEALETFRLPYYGRLWSSNLVQFICFHVLLLAMQWLVTSLTELRTAVGLLAFIYTVRSNQYDDPEGDSRRILSGEWDDKPKS